MVQASVSFAFCPCWYSMECSLLAARSLLDHNLQIKRTGLDYLSHVLVSPCPAVFLACYETLIGV